LKNNLIYGIRPVMEALEAGKTLDKVFVQNNLRGDLFRDLKQLLYSSGIQIQYVPQEKLNRLTRKNHQGVVAFLSIIPYHDITSIIPGIFEKGEMPLILILDRISDVRNFGAISRTAECTGVHALIIPQKGAAQVNEDAIKTSAGALHRIPVCKSTNLKDTLKFLKDSGLQVLTASEKGNDPYHKIDMNMPLAIVMGSEEDGVSEELMKLSDQLVSIPILGQIKSLNVSVAAGVLLYEAVRQRNG
jgi:23S rRNA (guanosine2251-2'-O)-methyltransferase